jgi:NADH-quinone oxidoreductase subunit C
MIAQDLKSSLQESCPGLEERDSLDWPAFNCPIDKLRDVLQALRENHGYDALMDATAIDNGVETSPRFTVVYHLFSTKSFGYVRIAANCESDEAPVAPTVTALFKSANWMEREN